MTLTELAMMLVATLQPHGPTVDAIEIAHAAVEAVELDSDEPLTGSKAGDVALVLGWAMGESSLRVTGRDGECLRGDGGRALGPMQMQHTPEALACAPATAVRLWLAMAHDSVSRCAALEPDARLAALASGNCAHGRAVSRSRTKAARDALRRVSE